MRAILGYIILVITVLYAVSRNHRWALFGMIACDNIRPGDPFIGFGMESVRFSITYYVVGLGLLLVFYRRYRITFDRFHWPILLLFMSVVNSGLHAPCWGPAVFQIDFWFKMLLQYYLICAFIRDEKEMRELYWAIALSVVVVGIRYCYGKFFTYERRFEGATGDRNEMAMAMAMAVPFVFILGLTTRDVRKRMFIWSLLIPIGLSNVLSLSRGGMLGMIGVSGYLLYRLHHKRWIVVVGVVGGLVVLGNLPTEVTARFMTIGHASRTDESARGRLNAWDASKAMARDRPMTGVGVGNFLVYFKRYAPNPNSIHVAHSSFYQLLGEQGLPGVAVWLYLVVMVWVVASWAEVKLNRLERGAWTPGRYYLIALKASWIGYVSCGAFLSQEDMDFFYHLVAITSRFTVFLNHRETELIEKCKRELREQANRPVELAYPLPDGATPAV
jgi:probable O-glycosylation ligase (exosortase A-associated)